MCKDPPIFTAEMPFRLEIGLVFDKVVPSNFKDLLTSTAEMLFKLDICSVFIVLVPSNRDDDLLTFTTEMLFLNYIFV